MPLDINVIIQSDPALFPLGVYIRFHGQWLQGWLIQLLKKVTPTGTKMPGHLRVSVLLCMTDLAHASKLKEHDDNDDFQGTTGRAA